MLCRALSVFFAGKSARRDARWPPNHINTQLPHTTGTVAVARHAGAQRACRVVRLRSDCALRSGRAF